MNLRSWILLLVVSLVSERADAQSADDRYLRVYGMIQEADRLADTGQTRPAITTYL